MRKNYYCFCSLRMFALSERANQFQKIPLNGHKSARKPHRTEETPNLSELSLFLYFIFLKPFTFIGYRNNRLFPIQILISTYILHVTKQCLALARFSEEWITVSAKMSSSKAFFSENRLLCPGMDKFKENHAISPVIVNERRVIISSQLKVYFVLLPRNNCFQFG